MSSYTHFGDFQNLWVKYENSKMIDFQEVLEYISHNKMYIDTINWKKLITKHKLWNTSSVNYFISWELIH